MVKRNALWLLLPIALQSTILLKIIHMGYGGIALFVWFPCLVRVELTAHLPTSFLVVPISLATKETHCSTYVVSHIVGYDAPESHQANKVLPPLEDPFSLKDIGEIVQGFQMFLIGYHN